MSKIKVLCTGSCGFIFSNFIRLGIRYSPNYSFVSVDKVASSYSLNNVYAHNRHKFHLADVSDAHIMDKIFELERPDVVIHGAAESNVDDSIASANAFITSNVLGTQVIANACVKHGVDRLIYISTDEVYGQLGPDDKQWTEESPISPRNPYSASKACGELIVKAASHTHGLKYNITRSCNNYGPRQAPKNLVPKTIKNIFEGKPIPIYGQGSQIREWIHVADNCFAILHILEHAAENETYNISAGFELTNIEMVQDICNILGTGHDLISFIADPRPGHDFRYSVDCKKIRALGWLPEFKFKKGLEMVVQWYSNNKWFFNQ
ncbi:MAG: dTDP-glucose 4,6-dehydratase [bacterium]|nr:dTDP-glucose 4,6-dehydratase [bacterium]